MSNKIILLCLISLFLISVGHAQFLELDKKDIKNGLIEKDNVTYKIVEYESVHVYGKNGYKYERIFVENLTKIEEIEKQIHELLIQISEKEKNITILEEEINNSKTNIDNLNRKLEAMKKEKGELEAKLKELETSMAKLKRDNTALKKITGNLLLSQTQSGSLVILFIALLLTSIYVFIKEATGKKDETGETERAEKIEEGGISEGDAKKSEELDKIYDFEERNDNSRFP